MPTDSLTLHRPARPGKDAIMQSVQPVFVALVPHIIIIRPEGWADTAPSIVIRPAGAVARVAATQVQIGQAGPVPIVRTTYGEVTGLPAPQPGTIYVVSGLVRGAITGRPDVVAPDTGPTAIRGQDGQIVAVRRFVGVARPCPECGGLGDANGCGPDHGYDGPCHGGPYATE